MLQIDLCAACHEVCAEVCAETHVIFRAEDYELALEKDQVQERLLLRRGHKADGSALSSTPADAGLASAVAVSQVRVLSLAGLLLSTQRHFILVFNGADNLHGGSSYILGCCSIPMRCAQAGKTADTV